MSLIKYVKQNIIQKKGKIIMNGQIIYVGIMAVLLVLIGLIASISIIKRAADEGMETFGMFLSCLIMIPCISFPISMVLLTVKEADMENNIESALNKNYAGYTNYHHDDTNTFVYDDKKYSFDYDYDTNTLVVFNETGTVIDGTYVNGQKMDDTGKTDINEIVSETELESKVPDTLVDTKEEDSASVSEDNSDLNRRIQSTILERYTDALITNYSASTLSGSFDSEGISYEFSWSDDLLEITEIENPNNVIYMKIAE